MKAFKQYQLIFLTLIIGVILSQTAFAGVIYKVTGGHELENSSDPYSNVIAYEELQIIDFEGLLDSPDLNMTRGGSFYNFRLKYQEENFTNTGAIDNVTLNCEVLYVNISSSTVQTVRTFSLLFDSTTDGSEDFFRKDFQLYSKGRVNCFMRTNWNQEFWYGEAQRNPPDYSALSIAWSLPSKRTDYCADRKLESLFEGSKRIKGYKDEVKGITFNFILINYKIFIIFIWLLLIAGVFAGGFLVLGIIKAFIDIIKRLGRRKPTEIVMARGGGRNG